jgi:hypothetical protein
MLRKPIKISPNSEVLLNVTAKDPHMEEARVKLTGASQFRKNTGSDR